MKVVLLVLWAVVGVVGAAPAPGPAKDDVVLRDVIPGASDVTVQGGHLLSKIPGVVRTGQRFDFSQISRLFPELAGAGSSSGGASSLPILVLGSAPRPSLSNSNFVRVNRQSVIHDSLELEDIISDDDRISLEDNLVLTAGDDLDSREDRLEIVSGSPGLSSVGVPLSTAVASISSSGSPISSSGSPISSSGSSVSSSGSPISSSGIPILSADLDVSSRTVGSTSSSGPPGPDNSLPSTTSDLPSESPAPATVPATAAGPGGPLPRGLGMLLNRHSARMNDPNMTLGSFLMGLNGKNGVMVLPSSSLDVVQNGGGTNPDPTNPQSAVVDTSVDVRIDVDGDDIHDFELDIDSSEANELGIIASSNPSTEASTSSTSTTSSTTVFTTTQSPTLFQDPLIRLLDSKGKFFGTIIGGLLDLGSIIMRRLMVFKPF